MFTASGYRCISHRTRPCPFAIIACCLYNCSDFAWIQKYYLPSFALGMINKKLRHRRVGWLPIHKCRYGSAASVKFRLGKIFPKNFVPRQKSDQNPTVTRHVLINFKVQKSQFLMSGPLFVYSLIKYYTLFIKNHQKNLCLTNITSQSLMHRQKVDPEKPYTCAGTSATTFSGNLTLLFEAINFISLT